MNRSLIVRFFLSELHMKSLHLFLSICNIFLSWVFFSFGHCHCDCFMMNCFSTLHSRLPWLHLLHVGSFYRRCNALFLIQIKKESGGGAPVVVVDLMIISIMASHKQIWNYGHFLWVSDCPSNKQNDTQVRTEQNAILFYYFRLNKTFELYFFLFVYHRRAPPPSQDLLF